MTSDSRFCTGGGASGQNLVHLQKIDFCVEFFLKSLSLQPLIRKQSYLDHRYPVGSMPWGEGRLEVKI